MGVKPHPDFSNILLIIQTSYKLAFSCNFVFHFRNVAKLYTFIKRQNPLFLLKSVLVILISKIAIIEI